MEMKAISQHWRKVNNTGRIHFRFGICKKMFQQQAYNIMIDMLMAGLSMYTKCKDKPQDFDSLYS